VSLAGAYIDQLERSNGLEPARIAEARQVMADAEKSSGTERQRKLTELAARLEGNAARAGDPAKVKMLAGVVGQLAAGPSLAGK
jgi:hypothetical protein